MAALPYGPFRVPMVDDSGIITPPWAHWFAALYARIGGPSAASNNELTEIMPEDAGIEEIKALLFSLSDGLGQASSVVVTPSVDVDTENRIASLAEELAVLRAQINDLQQGLYA